MTMKIAVSLPDELVAQARAAVRDGRAASVSAYVAAAMAAQSERESLATVLEDWAAELGPPAEGDVEWAMKALGGSLRGESAPR